MNQNSSHWMPFNSLFNGNEEKEKITVINKKKPVLSEEQIEAIENKIIEAFTEQVPVIIIHFHKYDFIKYLEISAIVFSIYYALKAIIIFTIEKKNTLKQLSDISEIVKEEPIKKEATKKKKEAKKDV